jgi:hypothetical protein
VTALVPHDLFGGGLMLGEVRIAGERVGVHYWNQETISAWLVGI